MELLQVIGLDGVVGENGFGDVVDEGDESDELEGDELNEGDEGDVFEDDELNELVCYDWMNDGLEGADFADDIFGGNEDDNVVPGEVVGIEGNNSTHEVGDNGGIMQVKLSHQCCLRLGAMGGIMQVILSHQCSLRLGAIGGIMDSLG